MKRVWMYFTAALVLVILTTGAAFGLEPVATGGTLSCCVDWLEGFTAHLDGIALATAVAPALTEELKKKLAELSELQKKQFEDLLPRIEAGEKAGTGVADLKEQIEKINGEVAKAVDGIEQARKEANDRQDKLEKLVKDGPGGAKKVDPVSAAFISKALPDEAAHKTAEIKQRTGAVEIKGGAEQWMTKNISSASGSGAALTDSLRLPGVITQPEDRLAVQALIPRTFTQNQRVDYVRELVYTDLTATVAESTGTGDLQTKPQGNITFELVTEAMKTIAQWIPASRQILHFSNRTQLQSYIDRRLRERVLLELEDQVLLGGGTGNDMTGLVTDATAYNRGYANIAGAAPTFIDTLRRAITQLQLVNYSATGIVLNPADWEEIELTKAATFLSYIFANPQQAAVPRMWGVPVVPSNRMTENKFLIGDFASGAELFVGMDVTVEVSREHASFFTQNMVAILAEMFATLAIYRPEGFIYGGGLNADS